MNTFFRKSLIVVFSFLIFSGQVFSAPPANWFPPAGMPTGNNVPAPVNIGDSFQTKTGGLQIDGNLTTGMPGNNTVFISSNDSYLRGLSIFEPRQAPYESGSFLVSFLLSAFYDDVLVGDSNGVSSPELAIEGRLKYNQRDVDGNPIAPLSSDEMTLGGYNRVLVGNTGGDVRWTTTANVGGGGGNGNGNGNLPTCNLEGSLLRWNDSTNVWECTTHALAFNSPEPKFDILGGSSLNILSNAVFNVGDGASAFIRPTGRLEIMSSLQNNNFKVGGSPGVNKILADRGDGQGFVMWKTATELGIGGGGGGGLPAGTANQTLRHNGTTWVANSLLENNGNFLKYNMLTNPADAKEGALLASTDDQGTMKWQPGLNLMGAAYGNGGNFWFDDFPADGMLNGNDDFSIATRLDSDFPITTNGLFVKNSATADPLEGAFISAEGRTYLKDLAAAPGADGLARVCIDTNGRNDVEGDEDDYQVYKCVAEPGSGLFMPDADSPTNVSSPAGGTSTTYTWTVPDEVYSIDITLISGGGGGAGGAAGKPGSGGNDPLSTGGGGGGGGGAGAVSKYFDVAVNPGDQLCIVAGLGGAGGRGESKYENLTYTTAQPGSRGGRSLVAGSNCNINQPLAGTGIAFGGFGGQPGEWGSSSIVIDGEVTYSPPDGGAGGMGGIGNWLNGANGAVGDDGFLVAAGGDVGAGGHGGDGGISGLGASATGGAGAGQWTTHTYDIDKDGSTAIGGNQTAEKIRGIGERGIGGINGNIFLSMQPGGGAGGGAARAGIYYNYNIDLDGDGSMENLVGPGDEIFNMGGNNPPSMSLPQYEPHICLTLPAGHHGCGGDGAKGGNGAVLISY